MVFGLPTIVVSRRDLEADRIIRMTVPDMLTTPSRFYRVQFLLIIFGLVALANLTMAGWEAFTIPSHNPIFQESVFDMDFLDESRGFALLVTLGENRVEHTADGGDTWEVRSVTDTKTNVSLPPFPHIQFLDENVGWVVRIPSAFNPKILLKTTDGGRTFEEFETPFDNVFAFYFASELRGWIVGNNEIRIESLVMYTTDGGETWMSAQTPFVAPGNDIFFLDEMNGWIARTFGGLLYTNRWWTDMGFGISSDEWRYAGCPHIRREYRLGDWTERDNL